MSDQFDTASGAVALPGGEWTLIGEDSPENDTSEQFVLARIGKDQDDNSHLDGLIFLTVSTKSSVTDWCERNKDALHFAPVSGTDANVKGCLAINELITRFDNLRGQHLSIATQTLDQSNVIRPDTMYFATFRLANDSKAISVSYGFDFRQRANAMIPDYAPAQSVPFQSAHSDEARERNLETVIEWARAYEASLTSRFFD
ncbi:MAG: hypothetical protein ACMZ66_10670 [Thalassospira sp.]|uniref:hypothetical protein n=1 Tax=Thalassospira sp. TaxID=1912094 RepID=UPI003A8A26DB